MSRDPRNDRPVMSHLLYCERCETYTPPTTASLGTLEPGCWVCGEPYLHQGLTAGWCPECESLRTSHTVRCPDCEVTLLDQRSQGCDVCRLTGPLRLRLLTVHQNTSGLFTGPAHTVTGSERTGGA